MRSLWLSNGAPLPYSLAPHALLTLHTLSDSAGARIASVWKLRRLSRWEAAGRLACAYLRPRTVPTRPGSPLPASLLTVNAHSISAIDAAVTRPGLAGGERLRAIYG